MRIEVESEALLIGMAIVPGLLSRNRCFALFEEPAMNRARRRAALVRGIVRQLAGAQGPVDSVHVAGDAHGFELRYRLPRMKVERRTSLSAAELACVRYLASRGGISAIRPSSEDRASIEAALRRLAAGLKLERIDIEGGA